MSEICLFPDPARSGTFFVKALLKLQLMACIYPFQHIYSCHFLIFKKYFQIILGKIMPVVPVSKEPVTSTESFHLSLSFVFLLLHVSHAQQKLHSVYYIKNRPTLHMKNLFNLMKILSYIWHTVTWQFMEMFEGLNTASRNWQCKYIYLEMLIGKSCYIWDLSYIFDSFCLRLIHLFYIFS